MNFINFVFRILYKFLYIYRETRTLKKSQWVQNYQNLTLVIFSNSSRFSCTKFGKRHDISLLEISQLFCTAKFLASDLLYLFVLSQHKLTNTSYTYLRLTELWKKSTLIRSLLYKEMCVLSTLWSFENRNCSITIF